MSSTSKRVKSCATAAANLQHLLKGVQGGEENWGTLCSEKSGMKGLQIVRFFRSWFYEPNSYISPFLEKHWSPSWWRLLLVTGKRFKRWAETCKNICLIVCLPPSRSHIYWPLPSASLEKFLTAIWGTVSQAAVLILPQIKLCNSCCAFFRSTDEWSISITYSFLHMKNHSLIIDYSDTLVYQNVFVLWTGPLKHQITGY